jgi:hypothetical protein
MDGIRIDILGDYGPFSRAGKSISYLVSSGRSAYLLDCGAPLFQQIGGYGLKEIKGLVITHCHDDHKRWLTDLALFHRYAPDLGYKILLLASEEVHDHLAVASGPALERGLTADSGTIVDIPYDAYVDRRVVGPEAKFRIVSGSGKHDYRIVDQEGKRLGPERAKVFVSPVTGSARMLLRDPECGEWIEPSTFYPFSSNFFYGRDKNTYRDEDGLSIEALNAPQWHGIPVAGFKFSTGKETVTFSSDTVHDRELWHRLSTEKRPQKMEMPREEFDAASIIHGDINNYNERIWSPERYDDAVTAFDDAVVVHDVAVRDCVVHTHYKNIKTMGIGPDKLLLTHSPDRMTSQWPLMQTGKAFFVRGRSFSEVVGDELFPMDGDIFHKEAGKYFVGYRSEKGSHTVFDSDGTLSLSRNSTEGEGDPLFQVELFEDLAGRYFPVLDGDDSSYRTRRDGKVEIVTFHDRGSTGTVDGNERRRTSAGKAPLLPGKDTAPAAGP